MSNLFDYEKLKLFYLGKETLEDKSVVPLVYKNKDLMTHAAIIGMTGSGKTGLGISLLEEAAIDNIPSIIIDPKGDMSNLLLTFPNLQASDFEPWIDESLVQSSGLNLKEFAQKTAKDWENGIVNDFQDKKRIEKLKNSADFTIYTPGSNSGVQVSILSSFKAPNDLILEDSDALIELINSTVSSILSLIELENNSSSKESLIISSILMNCYTNKKDISLEELISLIITPPFDKIGVFDLETYYSKDSRLKLALKLNNIIANTNFKNWIEGESLDISNLLYDEQGKAKVSIFSISHLNDSQRMFFVTLLLNEIVSWMRRQEGTSSLKALLYMDEIFGYFPPNSNPPSKQPMLTLLKQARSFGLGVVLSTQNPVDIDYKGLSNIGTWFIGRLQTKQDKEKVIDGLSSANSSFDKNELMKIISNLEKRSFILKNINEEGIKIFKTRWALSYLKGPISKDGIKKLMEHKILKKDTQQNKEEKIIKKTNSDFKKPLLPLLLEEKFIYNTINDNYYLQGYLLLSCKIHFVNSAKNIDMIENYSYTYYLNEDDNEFMVDDLEEFIQNNFQTKSRENSSYYPIPSFIQNEKSLKNIEKTFSNFIYTNKRLNLYKIEKLKLISKPKESLQDFKIRVQDRLNESIDEEIEKIKIKFIKQEEQLQKKLQTLQSKLQREQQQASKATADTIISIGASILGAFFGKSLLNKTNISKVATTARGANRVLKEKSDVNVVQEDIEELNYEIDKLKEELQIQIDKINNEFKMTNFQIEETFFKPKRGDIFDLKIELLWKEE